MKIKRFSESLESPDSIEDIFRELELDHDLSIDVKKEEDEFSNFYIISIKIIKKIDNFSSLILSCINRSIEMTGLEFELIEMMGDRRVYHRNSKDQNGHLINDLSEIDVIDKYNLSSIVVILTDEIKDPQFA